jgi:tRNA(adenine34) deaminase
VISDRSETGVAKETRVAGQDEIDAAMMMRCIELSKKGGESGEYPFACLICKGTEIYVESTNRSTIDQDTSRHAELLALTKAQHRKGGPELGGYTLYTNVEPCVMCSLAIRETRISRVVYAIESPLMGGHTRWNILRDEGLSNIVPEGFGAPPEIVAGLCTAEAEAVWHQWNPITWHVLRSRGCFGGGSSEHLAGSARHGWSFLHLIWSAVRRVRYWRAKWLVWRSS